MNFQGYEGDVHGPPSTVHFLFKMEEVHEHDLYLNQILHHFDLNFFYRMNNKKITNRGPQGAPGGPTPISLQSEYSSSN